MVCRPIAPSFVQPSTVVAEGDAHCEHTVGSRESDEGGRVLGQEPEPLLGLLERLGGLDLRLDVAERRHAAHERARASYTGCTHHARTSRRSRQTGRCEVGTWPSPPRRHGSVCPCRIARSSGWMTSAVERPIRSADDHPSRRSTDGDSHSITPSAFVTTTKSDMFSASRRYRSSDSATSRAAADPIADVTPRGREPVCHPDRADVEVGVFPAAQLLVVTEVVEDERLAGLHHVRVHPAAGRTSHVRAEAPAASTRSAPPATPCCTRMRRRSPRCTRSRRSAPERRGLRPAPPSGRARSRGWRAASDPSSSVIAPPAPVTKRRSPIGTYSRAPVGLSPSDSGESPCSRDWVKDA